MSRVQVLLQHGANAAVGLTGIVYFVMRYLLESDDPYAVVGHPWQPAVQHLHVLAAPVLVFVTGLVWTSHVAAHWSADRGRRRLSGVGLVLSFAPMVVSGYLLQVAVEEPWRSIWAWLHVGTGTAWIAGYLAHLTRRQRVPRSPPGAPSNRPAYRLPRLPP